MLPLPNLDDRSFEKIVQESRKLIPKLFPEWTDENVHDPGITLIELLAWLTEMQQYHLNQVTDEHELKFLKLLGYQLRQAQPAKSHVTFRNVEAETVVPRGTKLLAHQVPFETVEPVRLTTAHIDKIIISTKKETNDFTASNDDHGVSFPAFGVDGSKGSRMYIGLNRPLPVDTELAFLIKLFDQYPVRKGEFKSEEDIDQFVPSGKVEWHVYSFQDERQAAPGWTPLNVIEDETIHFSQSGRLIFRLEQEMHPLSLHPAADKRRYWLSCTVVEEGFEIPPRVEKISLNSVPVVNWETESIAIPYDSDGAGNQSIVVEHALALSGHVELQVQEESGDWVYWNEVDSFTQAEPQDQVYRLERDWQSKKVTITFGDGERGARPPKGTANIRVIAYQPSFERERLIGRSTGLPNQVFTVKGEILPEHFQLQVGYRPKDKNHMVWQDWHLVNDFDLSSSSARHFQYHREMGTIHFGNNERGWIPPRADEANIMIISKRIGGGEQGNVNRHTISKMVDVSEDLENVEVVNHFPAVGGKAAETLPEAKENIQRELFQGNRAVTMEDFERIALNTPGLRMARVKAIPAYVPGLLDYPQQKAPGQVTVVVVPYSLDEKPMPSDGFLKTTKRYLDRYRLLTNHVHVIPPEYIKVTVHAVVVIEPGETEIEVQIRERLHQYLKPLGEEHGSAGWEFGKTVFKGDIYGVLNQIPGVTYVQDLWLNAEGSGAVKMDGGNIRIPPHGLVFSGRHEIELINRHDL